MSRLRKRTLSKRTRLILRAHARVIQELGRRAIGDIIEIGRRLTDAKERLGHGKFLTWLAAEFGWSERTAENFMRVYDLHCKSEKFPELEVPISALYLLAAPSTPDKALEEVAMRVGNGNGVSVAEVKDIIAKSRRGSSLRHLLHVALEILDVVERQRHAIDRTAGEKAASGKWDEILDRHLGDLDRDQVRAILHQKCLERLERRKGQLFHLKHEIASLEAIRDWSEGPLQFTRFPSKAGPHVGVPFFVCSPLTGDAPPPADAARAEAETLPFGRPFSARAPDRDRDISHGRDKRDTP